MKKTPRQIDYTKIYSPYKLSMFEQCPKAYHFFYLDPIYSRMKADLKKQPKNIWPFNTLGKAIHNAITLFFHLPFDQRTKKNLLSQLEKTWTSEVQWNKKMPLGKWGGFEDLEEERDYYTQAILMLKNFLKMIDLGSEIAYLPTQDLKNSISDYQELIVPLNDQTDISGKFDLIIKNKDDSLWVIDFKTGKKEEDNSFQLNFYKLLAEKNFKKPVKKASYYFLKRGIVRDFDFESQKTTEIEKEVLKKIGRINQELIFETKPSKLCRFCLFKNFCPDKKKAEAIIGEVTEEEYADDLPF